MTDDHTAEEGLSVSVSPHPSDTMFDNRGFGSQITLDLTKPPSMHQYGLCDKSSNSSDGNRTHNTREADILAGCSALLALGCQSHA